MTAFWVLAPIMVLAAIGLVLSRRAVHSALCLAVVMISLAMLYAVQDAPFLFAVQIIVYTGAIMMLFLFVLMLVGVESSESLVETLPGHRIGTIVFGILFAAMAVLIIGQVALGTVVGLDQANSEGNVHGLATLLFDRYVLAFEFTGGLLITATLGAMVLAHRERLHPRRTQRQQAEQRMRDYADSGKHPGVPPTPGVFARHNAVDTRALLPDGTPAPDSVPPSLSERGQVRDGYDHDIDKISGEIEGGIEDEGEDE